MSHTAHVARHASSHRTFKVATCLRLKELMTCFRSGFQDLLAHAKNTSSCMRVCVLAVQSVGDDTQASPLRGANSVGSEKKKTVFVSVDGWAGGWHGDFRTFALYAFHIELDLVCVVFSYMLKPVFSRCLACGPVSRKLGEQHEFLEKVNLRLLVFFSHFALLQLAGSCNHSISSAVLSSQWCEGATAICQIRLLCKTTKSPGEVTFRCVHSRVSNMWTGLSAWLAHHLRVKIEMKLPRLLRDTKEFVDDLRHFHWQDGMCMVKKTSKSFTFQVNQVFLSRACSELFCDETEDFQQLVARAVDWLCRNRFVQSDFLPDFTYRVTRGSGMGPLRSGEVSDAGFWIAAERWLLNTSVRKWCSLTNWECSEMTSSRSQAIFLDPHMFSVGSALVQHSRVTSSWQKTSVRIRSLSWLLMSWWSMAVL